MAVSQSIRMEQEQDGGLMNAPCFAIYAICFCQNFRLDLSDSLRVDTCKVPLLHSLIFSASSDISQKKRKVAL